MPEHVLIQRVHSGEAMMLNLDDESYFGLNAVGARMLDVVLEEANLDAAVETLALEYDVDRSELQGDLKELLESLRSRGLIDLA